MLKFNAQTFNSPPPLALSLPMFFFLLNYSLNRTRLIFFFFKNDSFPFKLAHLKWNQQLHRSQGNAFHQTISWFTITVFFYKRRINNYQCLYFQLKFRFFFFRCTFSQCLNFVSESLFLLSRYTCLKCF